MCEADKMKPVLFAVILSCCLAYAYCTHHDQCSSSQTSTVHTQWASTFGSDQDRLREFAELCYERSATFDKFTMPYEVALSLTQFVSLHDRREHLNIFFTSITIPSSCFSRLLPPLRDSSITSRLRTPSLYPDLQPALNATIRLYTMLY